MHKFIVNLTNKDLALIDDAKLECFLVDTQTTGAENIVKRVHAIRKLVLISGENACEKCNIWQADGVLIDLSKSEHLAKEVNFARKQIGEKALGVISRNRRHESMLISEAEPDFVAFKAWNQGIEQVKELVSWYNEMFLIQSAVVLQEEISQADAFECDLLIVSAETFLNIENKH